MRLFLMGTVVRENGYPKNQYPEKILGKENYANRKRVEMKNRLIYYLSSFQVPNNNNNNFNFGRPSSSVVPGSLVTVLATAIAFIF